MANQVSTGTMVAYLAALATDTLKIGLLKSGYTPNPDHKFVSDVAAQEVDATNYAGGFGGAGRKTLAGKTIVENTTTDRVVFDANDPALWASLGGATNNAMQYAFVCKEVTNDAASPLIAVLEMDAVKNTNGTDFTLALNAAGILTIQC